MESGCFAFLYKLIWGKLFPLVHLCPCSQKLNFIQLYYKTLQNLSLICADPLKLGKHVHIYKIEVTRNAPDVKMSWNSSHMEGTEITHTDIWFILLKIQMCCENVSL